MTDTNSLERQILDAIAQASDETALESVRVAALGKKGSISELLKTLGAMSPEERKSSGPLFNTLRDRVTDAIAARKTELANAALNARLASERIDVTLPARPEPQGTIHPVSQVLDEVTAIFADLGFAVAEGPDIEFDDYNFTKLNIPPDHPARQMHDTFYVARQADGSQHVLRTHTSPGAGAHDAEAEAADPHRRARAHLSRGFRRDPLADVPSVRRPRDRREHQSRSSEMGAGRILQGVLRSRSGRAARASVVLPVHRAERRVGSALRPFRAGQDQVRHRQ